MIMMVNEKDVKAEAKEIFDNLMKRRGGLQVLEELYRMMGKEHMLIDLEQSRDASKSFSVSGKKTLLSKFLTFDDESELRSIEDYLSIEIKEPYVRCSYDSHCSHKAENKEELDYRVSEGMLEPNEYIINYELYETKTDYEENKGGYDGEVYELVYTIDEDDNIRLKYCYHKDWR